MTDLADILKSRAIRSVYYFHADHFEPWSLGLNEKTARGVERFGEMSRTSPYASKISIFYCPYVPYLLIPPGTGKVVAGHRVDGDGVTFGVRSQEQENLAQQVIRPLMAAGAHEFHLHVHHEFWTRNDSNFDNPVSRWVNANSTATLDEKRLDLFFRLAKDVIARELGAPFEHWAFVHGNWALAASDPLICKIETELGMIMRHGGFGDFSFPAGRAYCDPRLPAPFTCLPIDGKRPYDEPASDPRRVEHGSKALGPGRFFIWNSPIKAAYSSIDYYSAANRELLKDHSAFVAQWLGSSVNLGDALFIKTHAHSMKWEYKISEDDSPIPHCHPDVVKVFEELLKACDRAGVEFKPVTVNEVMELISTFDSGRDMADVRAAWNKPRKRERKMEAPAAMPSIGAAPGRRRVRPAAEPAVRRSAAQRMAVQLRREEAPPADRFAALEQEMTSILRTWVLSNPAHAQGAGDFYRELLATDHLLQDYERALLDYVLAECSAKDCTIVEVGVGYGILSLLLATAGYDVVAFEGDRSRFAGLRVLEEAMARQVAAAGGELTPVCGWFPDAFDAATLRTDRRTVLVTTNIVASASAQRQDAILEAARTFDELLIDTTRFGIRRYEPDAAESFRTKIAAIAEPVKSVWRKGPNEIWHFRTFKADEGPTLHSPTEVSMDTVTSPVAGRPAVDIAAFNDELLGLQRSWVAGPGAPHQPDDLYAAKLARNSTLEAYETVIAAAIGRRFESDTEIVEIGSGYGALALLLARNGFVVHGFEGDRRRSAACAWHFEEYSRHHPELDERVLFTPGFFPEAPTAVVRMGRGKRLCVATNITCSYTANHHTAIVEAMSGFDAAIIDLGRFGRSRNAQDERDALREELAKAGLEPVERLYFSAPYEYWLFRAKRVPEAATTGAKPAAATPPPVAPAPAALGPIVPVQAKQGRSAKARRTEDPVFPLSGDAGVLYTVYGDRHIDACPVCHGEKTTALWRMPMSSLKEPISVFGGYFNQIPTLQVPSTVYCFDFCRDCESIFLNPAPKMQKDQYRKSDHYLRILKDNAAQWQGYENAYGRFAKWIPEDATVLMDAACGIGPYLHVARKHAPERWRRLIGLELSEKYVDYMRTQGMEAHSFDIDNDDLNAIVEAGSVDFITFCEAFEHVERPLDSLQKLLVTLRPGGRMYFTAQRYGPDVQAAVRPGEPIYIGDKVMKELPSRLGCKVVDVTTSGMRYYVVLEK